MSGLPVSDGLPWLALIFVGVTLLIQGLWLIWGRKWLASRATAERWRRISGRGSPRGHDIGANVGEASVSAAAMRRTDRARRARSSRWGDWIGAVAQPLRDAEFQWSLIQIAVVVSTLAAALLFAGWLLHVPAVILAIVGLGVLGAPWWMALRRLRNRSGRLQEQLGDAVDLVARALRAGHALPSALRMVGDQSPDPIAREFRIACERIGLGVPADEALRGMAARSRSEDLRYFVIAVLLQRETGGNLAEVLDNISGLVRQRHQLRQSVRALSAEGRLSAWILGILPFALAGVISFINPDLMSLLWTDPAGRLLCGTAIFMMAIGIFLMRQIVRVRA
jgi:tight adherence protein B